MTFIWQCLLLMTGLLAVGNGEDFVDLSPEPTIFETDRLPEDGDGNFLPRYMASIGNGHVATTLYTDTVFMNGLYSGVRGESHRARIPSRNNIRVGLEDQIEVHRYSLDLQKGIFVEKITTSDYQVDVTSFAHRFYHKVIAVQITAKPLVPEPKPTFIHITSTMGSKSEDIEFGEEAVYSNGNVFTCGYTMEIEDTKYQESNSTVCVITTVVPPGPLELTNQSITLTYFAAYGSDITTAALDFDAVHSLLGLDGGHEQLLNSHTEAWRKVWDEGRIEVDGNPQLGKVIYGSLYYILSSLPVTEVTNSPVGQFYGLSPGGLGYGARLTDYQGHSFWDTETWMYPPVLYFYPKAAREILNYRLHVVPAARDLAAETGRNGTRFPWESGFTGREVTPDCCPETRDFQIHITADIGFAVRQYIAATRDLNWLRSTQSDKMGNGCGLIHEIALFWNSRTVCDADRKLCEIKGVMPPDEDHHDVDNSVYTNVGAGYALHFAKYAHCLCDGSMDVVPDDWITKAEALKLIFDEELQYHPEFDNYTIGTSIKQADVVLLGFPLMYKMDPKIRRNDLNIYEQVTRPDGPAMTWAMHTIGFLDVDEVDTASVNFNRSYQSYIRQPFKIWTEAQPPTLGAVNFITGMGGFLQSIVSGYGGLRLYPEEIVFFKPRVPPQSDSLKLIGLDFLENEFNVLIEQTKVTLNFTTLSAVFPPILTSSTGEAITIGADGVAAIDSSAGPVTFTLKTSTQTNCPLPLDEINLTPINRNSAISGGKNSIQILAVMALTLGAFLY